jgi:hypothetical protein
MIKLFVSQPMNGKTNDEILAEREQAKKLVEYILGEEVELIDSFFKDEPNVNKKPLWCLGKSLELLAEADVVHFVEGWENYRGCKIERQCAEQYGVDIV